MPGTIHVTVLEFKGVSSSSKPSAKSLKVSMGKRQFQTWDKGNFSFPITRIRENLVVALLDAGGNEIAHQDIRTMQIIEKGSWDEVFSINGGGHVHMKLQFTLSEEDRSRVRVMRESAMKRKLETNPNVKVRFSEAVTSTSGSVETSMNDEERVSGEQVMKIVGVHHNEAKTHQANKISSEMQKNPMHKKDHKMEKNPKKVHLQPESGSASSPNGSSNGLVGQVLKLAVIVGFGVLVFLTRQKEPRKKHREEKDSLFHIPDYVDETTLKPWTGKQ